MVASFKNERILKNKGPFKYIITPFWNFLTPPPCVILHLLLMNVMRAIDIEENSEKGSFTYQLTLKRPILGPP